MKNSLKILVLVALLSLSSCISLSARTMQMSKIDSLSMRVANMEQLMAEEQKEIELCKKELSICEKSLHSIDEHVDRTNETISNQITASSHTIQVWGVIIAIVAVVITIFMSIMGAVYAKRINRIRKNIQELTSNAKIQLKNAKIATDEIAEQQERVSANQTEIVNLQSKINTEANQIRQNLEDGEKQIEILQELYGKFKDNSSKIYSQLHKEETKRIIERLKEVPEDISNVESVLLSRDLDDASFDGIYEAYKTLIQRYFDISQLHDVDELRKTNPSFLNKENGYAILFAQHFFKQSIATEDLRNLIRKKLSYLMSCYYKNDAEKSTKDFKMGLQQVEEKLSNEMLKEYILALGKSKYANFKELYEILLMDLNEEQLKDIWKAVVEQNSEAYTFAKVFEKAMMHVSQESALLQSIIAYIDQEKKEVAKK